MKYLFLSIAVVASLITTLPAQARNTPCSGKKGGVASCTSSGKFLCRDGSTSASKQQCTR